MKIGIVGAGAIGMLFGAYLSQAKHEVTFLVRDINLNNRLYIEKDFNSTEQIHCNLVNNMELLHSMDLIIIAVKYHHLNELKADLDRLPVQTPLLFIQNGLLHLKFINQLNQHHIAVGSVLHGATKMNSNTVRHLGVGITTIGVYKGRYKMTNEFIQSSSSDFPLEITNDIEKVVLRKVVLNCLINPLTTIAQVPNGELVNNESFHTIMRNIYEEIIEAFGEDFVELSWDAVVLLCEKTKNNRSSMLTDYENDRVMEIDTIVGALIGEAKLRNKRLPILHTFYLLLTEMNRVGEDHH